MGARPSRGCRDALEYAAEIVSSIMRAVDVTSKLIARYIDSHQRNSAANSTANRELPAMKRMFRLGMQSTPAKVLRLPAFPKLKENNVRKGIP